MQLRSLGRSGLQVSAIGLGTNQFGGKVEARTVIEIVDACLDLGINFIDTADIYQKGRSEETLGAALAGRRSRFIIATKAFHPTGEDPNQRGTSRKHLLAAIEASLRRLQTDCIDLYQMHRPDPNTPLEETLHTLDDLVHSGKVRYIGASNYAAWHLAYAQGITALHGWESFISIQPHYHMLHREIEGEIIPASRALGLGILPYFPLAGGFLTGKYQRGQSAPPGSRGENSPYVQKYMTGENFDRLDSLTEFAQASGHTLGDLAQAWLLAQPQVSSVISGATRVAHVQANAVAADYALSSDELTTIENILNPPAE
ncbi:MAG: aldo/keto reductase [Anaerolineae bacterium]|nr:MAG: aldo/keto reductase [Anaerolineae bacterium]